MDKNVLKERLIKLQSSYGFFSDYIIDEMIDFFKAYKETQPIFANLYDIEFNHLIPDCKWNDEDYSIIYGNICSLQENEFKDIMHQYRYLKVNNHELAVIKMNDEYKLLDCHVQDIDKTKALIILAPQNVAAYEDYLIMHELGHIVKIFNGHPMSEATSYGFLEELIADVLAIAALAKYRNVSTQEVFKTDYEKAIIETINYCEITDIDFCRDDYEDHFNFRIEQVKTAIGWLDELKTLSVQEKQIS